MKLRVAVLGATGSIGMNTLDVLSRHPERFQVYALTASTQVDLICLLYTSDAADE